MLCMPCPRVMEVNLADKIGKLSLSQSRLIPLSQDRT
jgi:hypothetical protein